MSKKDIALIIAGIIFTIVSIFHFLRLVFKTKVTIANYTVPMKVSLWGFIISLALAVWMFMISSY